MIRLTKQWTFEAAHQLTTLPEDHPCSRLHGHSYTVTVELQGNDGDLNEHGMLVDYKVLDMTVGAWIKDYLDHEFLNELFDQPTTAELLSKGIFDYIRQTWAWGKYLRSVTLNETGTRKTSATYSVV